MALDKHCVIVDFYEGFNGPSPTRLCWVVVESRGETRGQQVRLTPQEARELGYPDAANLAAVDNAVMLGGAL